MPIKYRNKNNDTSCKQDIGTFKSQFSIQGSSNLKGGYLSSESDTISYSTDNQLLKAQNNIIPNSDNISCTNTFNNQYSTEGLSNQLGGTVDSESNNSFTSTHQFNDVQNNEILNSNNKSSVSTFNKGLSIQGLNNNSPDGMNGGNCSIISNIQEPCNLMSPLNVPKCGPNLSQSQTSFDVRYFEGLSPNTQKAGGYYFDLNNREGGLPPVKPVFDPISPKYTPQNAELDYPNPSFCKNQKGAAYQYIVNPSTNRKVQIKSKLGKSILKKFLNRLQGGDISVFDDNMLNRKFDCSQPYWKPECI